MLGRVHVTSRHWGHVQGQFVNTARRPLYSICAMKTMLLCIVFFLMVLLAHAKSSGLLLCPMLQSFPTWGSPGVHEILAVKKGKTKNLVTQNKGQEIRVNC